MLTHAAPIRVERGMTARLFCAEVLKILTDIHASTRPTGALARGRQRGRELAGALTNADEIDEARFWRRVTRMIWGEDAVSAGLSVLAVGAQYQPVRLPAEIDDVSLFEELGAAFA